MPDKHTPAPWTMAGVTDSGIAFSPDDKGFCPVGACGCCDSPWVNGETEEEMRANALLIARAPDLLAENERLRAEIERLRAIEKLTRTLVDRPDFWQAVRAHEIAIPGELDDVVDALKGA